MDEWFSDPEIGTMKGVNLIGYIPNDGLIHWFSVDNMGTAHVHIGSWDTPDHFSMQAEATSAAGVYRCMILKADLRKIRNFSAPPAEHFPDWAATE